MESTILLAVKTAIFAFVTLFPIVNPIGDAPIFLELTRHYPEPVQGLLARKIAVYGFLLLAGSLVLGTAVLAFFDISVPTIQIAGGLIVANTGWRLLNQQDDNGAADEQLSTDTAIASAFYPLTLPLTVGPGCISVSMTLGAHLRQVSGEHYLFRLPLFLSALSGMAALCILVWMCYGNARRLVKVLGPTGTSIVTRLSSFILMAIGLQIIWNGLSAAIHHLIHHASAGAA